MTSHTSGRGERVPTVSPPDPMARPSSEPSVPHAVRGTDRPPGPVESLATGTAGDRLSASEAWQRIQELRARQAEMETQNAELRTTQAALRESEEQLRFLSENLADGMVYQIDSGPDGHTRRFSYIAAAVERFHGVSAAEARENPALVYGQVLPEDQALVRARESHAVATRTPLDVEVRVRLPAGEVRWRRFRSAPRTRADGHVVWDGIELDTTEQRAAQAEQERLRHELAQSQKLEAVGRLAGGVAHDVNNALQAISGHAELALMEADLPATVQADLADIRRAAQHSADLIRQLLTFARRRVSSPEVLDLNEAVDRALGMLRRLIGEQIELVWEPAADLCRVRLDPAHVGQILANLCLNARDAIVGAGRITVRTEDLFVAADGRASAGLKPGRYAVIAVSDDGCGMGKEVLEHMFEPFFTTKGTAGTGLGLAIVYGLVTQNHGHIDVASEPGRGTTFRICLPAAVGAAAVDVAAASPAPRAEGGKTVLLVEDDEGSRLACQRMLTGLGYSVLAADGAEGALALAAEHAGHIDLLLSDVVMPGLPADELAVRLLASRPALRCLFMSGYPDEVIRRRGVPGTGEDFIAKPFSLGEIGAKVKSMLE